MTFLSHSNVRQCCFLRIAVRIPILALLLPLIGSASDYSSLLEEATDALDNDFEDNWAYTETTVESDGTYVGRYDPTRPDNQRWTLLTVDGRTPTDDEFADFLDEKADEVSRDEDNDDDSGNDVGDMVQPDSLELIEESDDHWLFSFVPSEDEEDEGFLEHVDATLKIARNGPYLEIINLQSSKPFKPQFGVKVSNFVTRLQFGPAATDGPIVPVSVDIRIKARAFLAISVDETVSISYSDYKYVGE